MNWTGRHGPSFLPGAGDGDAQAAGAAPAALEDRINAIHRRSLDGSTAFQCFLQESA